MSSRRRPGRGRPSREERGGGGSRERPGRGGQDEPSGRPELSPPGDILYGRNPVREALAARRRGVGPVWATHSAAREPWLEGVQVHALDAEALAARCGSDSHQGVCARAAPYPYAEEAGLLADPNALVVALDEVQDPQNLGAICRTAEAAGASGVVIPRHRSAEVTPAVCKASAGAVEHLAVARTRNVADFLGQAKAAGAWCYGATAGARVAYDEPDYRGRVVLVLGAEGRGLRPRVAKACDALVALPLHGRVSSLNVSATAAVVLYEILQRRAAA